MGLCESIHQFVGEHETLRLVRHCKGMTVLLTGARFAQIRHDGGQTNPGEIQGVRTIQFNRLIFADCSAELEPKRTIVGFHDSTSKAVRLVTLPARDSKFTVTFSAIIGDTEIGTSLAGN